MFSTNENIFSSPYGFIAVSLYTGMAWALATRMSLLLLLFRGCLPQLQMSARGRVFIPSRCRTELYIVTITDSQLGAHQLVRQVVSQLIVKLWAAHRTNCSRESATKAVPLPRVRNFRGGSQPVALSPLNYYFIRYDRAFTWFQSITCSAYYCAASLSPQGKWLVKRLLVT